MIEMIHPQGWFPAGRPLPLPEPAPRRDAAPPLPPEAREDSPAARASALLDQAAAARARMAWAEAAAFAEAAVEEALQASEVGRYAEARNEQACVAILAGDLGRAEEACGLSPRNGEAPGQRARTLVNYAVLEGLGGKAEDALESLDDAARLLAPDDEHGRLLASANRALALVALERLGPAEQAAADALRGARRAKRGEHWIAVGQMASALVSLARGARSDARSRLGDAARGFGRSGDRLREIQCHHLLGELAYLGEDPIRAGSHYRDGLALAREAGAWEAIDLLTLRFEHR